MIKHIVMFKLKNTDGKTAYENALAAKEKAQELLTGISYISSLEIRINSKDAAQSNFEFALICDFDDMEALSAYQIHSQHKKFGAFITPLREENGRACIDYEY